MMVLPLRNIKWYQHNRYARRNHDKRNNMWIIYLVSSFTELVLFLFTLPGVIGFLSNRINQRSARNLLISRGKQAIPMIIQLCHNLSRTLTN